jgi:hypothetical protein
MSQSCIVLIASPELLSALRQRTAEADGELITFTDTEALRALDAITTRRPAIVSLDRLFASTPRGAALINRIKADPTLAGCEIRIVSPDGDPVRVVPRRAEASPAPSAAGATMAVTTVAPAPSLDQRGTRRAPRYRMGRDVDALVDGNTAALVDLSIVGAQVVTDAVLKPNQRIRVTLTDEEGTIRLNASVAWAKFEIPPNSGPRYRAGIEFLDANAAALDAYCERNRA